MRRAGACLLALPLALAAARPARADVTDALANYKAGRYLEAVADLQAVLDRTPAYPYGHFLLGHCLLRVKRVADAQNEFRTAIALDGTRAEFHHGYALSLNAVGNWPFAIREASEGLERTTDPRTRHALLALRGYAFGSLRRWPEAIADLESAQRIRPEQWILIFLGRARFALGDFTGAVAPLRQVLVTAPDDTTALRLLAEIFLRLAAADTDPMRKRSGHIQALAYAQHLGSVAPGDLDVLNLIARTNLAMGNLSQAEGLFRSVLGGDPRQCYAMANLGRTLMAQGRWSEAETFLSKASVCAPRLIAVYESLGEVYLRTGKPQLAAEAFRRAQGESSPRALAQPTDTIPAFAPR